MALEENSPETRSFIVRTYLYVYWFCDFVFGYEDLFEPNQVIIMTSEDPKMSKHGTAGNNKQ